jgi:Type II CAAX prenyl endopeptidase Rce1-like
MSASDQIDTASGGNKRKLSAGLIVLVVSSLIGFVFFALFDKSVFPAASIDFKLNKADAATKATELAGTVGYDITDNFKSTTFSFDDDAKTLLEFKLGIDQANKLMKDEIPVWMWRTRFCKPLSHEELVVAWTTHGQLGSFDHTIDNDKKLPSLPIADARKLAKDFVEKTGGIDLTSYELTEEGSKTKANRVDHHFLWRKLGYPEAELRAQVEVAGNLVCGYRYYLSPLETWTREYKKIRETNDLLGTIASFFFFGFLIAAVAAFVSALPKHDVRWRFTITASALVALLVLLEQWNNFEYAFSGYNTAENYHVFIIKEIAMALTYAGLAFIASVLIAGGGETIYRRYWPHHAAAEFLFSLKGLSVPGIQRKMLMGYLVPGVMMLWTISYYKLGQKVGFFCPLGVDDYNVLGSYCPAISGALIGVTAAGMEEFLCRVVALSLLQKLFRNFWVANFLQAVIWGFAHSQYPQEPPYARGVELTVVGLLFGWIVRSYGILPCLIAHYLYDAFLTVEPVFASKDPVMIVPSVAVLFPFLLLGWLGFRWARKNQIILSDADVSNEKVTGVPVLEAAHVVEDHSHPLPYQSLGGRVCAGLLCLALLGLVAGFLVHSREIGRDKQVTIGQHQAIKLAAKVLADSALPTVGYSSVAELLMKPDAAEIAPSQNWQYLFEKLGPAGTAAIYEQTQPAVGWLVKFFKEHEARSYSVFLSGTGRLRGCHIEDVETAPGAKLTEAQAKKIAEDYVTRVRPEFVPFKFDSIEVKKELNRYDYTITYLIPKFNATSTACKINVEMLGDKVISVPVSWDIPDEWSWKRRKQTLHEQIHTGLLGFVGIIALVLVMIWSIHVLRSVRIPWKSVLIFGAIICGASIVRMLNYFGPFLAQYNTAETFESFISRTVALEATKFVVILMVQLLVCIVGFACIRFSFPDLARQVTSKALLAPNSAQTAQRTLIWRDACLASYAFLGVVACMHVGKDYVAAHFSPAVLIDIPAPLQNIFSATIPSLDVLSSPIALAALAPFALAVLASFCKRYLSSARRLLPVILFVALVAGTASKFWKQCAIDTIYDSLLYILGWWFITRVFRLNAISYIFVVLELAAAQNLGVLLAHAQTIGMPEICVSVALLLLPLLGFLAVWLKDRTSPPSGSAGVPPASMSDAPSV